MEKATPTRSRTWHGTWTKTWEISGQTSANYGGADGFSGQWRGVKGLILLKRLMNWADLSVQRPEACV